MVTSASGLIHTYSQVNMRLTFSSDFTALPAFSTFCSTIRFDFFAQYALAALVASVVSFPAFDPPLASPLII
jgi:hypothetical protein